MLKKVAILISLIALSIPVIFKVGFIEFERNNNPTVIAYEPANPSDSPSGCAGYPIPEDKPVSRNNERALCLIQELHGCGLPCSGNPEPVIEYPKDKLYDGGKVAHPVDIVICRIPCGGDLLPLI